jgi:hypothetical protein
MKMGPYGRGCFLFRDFNISVHMKFDLIRGMVFGWKLPFKRGGVL